MHAPETGVEPVDVLGCSLVQFCAGFADGRRRWRAECRHADWLNDEPAGARDCRAFRGACVPR